MRTTLSKHLLTVQANKTREISDLALAVDANGDFALIS